MTAPTVLITGASGNLGSKLRCHLQDRYRLVLLDLDPRSDSLIHAADLAQWDAAWVQHFRGVDVVVHLAADPTAHQSWPNLIGPNIDVVCHVFEAARQMGVQRVVYASSNHVLGGYSHREEPATLTPETPPLPGAQYVSFGEARDSRPYGSTKLFGERLSKLYAEVHGMSVIAVRIGWVRPGDNLPQDVPLERGPWFRLMWLSNRDYCQFMERCLLVQLPTPFVILNAMSNNTGMRWDLTASRRILGYNPQDDVTRGIEASSS